MIRVMICCLWTILFLACVPVCLKNAFAQEKPASPPEQPAEFQSAPVVVDGAELFRVRGVSAYPANTRARIIASRIKSLAADPTISIDSISIEDHEDTTAIKVGEKKIMEVIDADADLEGLERQNLAKAIQLRISNAIRDWRSDRSPSVLRKNALRALLVTLAFVLIITAGHWLFRRMTTWLQKQLQTRLRDVKIQKFKLVSREQLIRLLTLLIRFTAILFLVIVSYLYLDEVLSLFPWTRGLANWMFGILTAPVHTFVHGLARFIPDLIFLLFLYFLIRYVLILIRGFFNHVAEERVALPGFESEWSWPTYRLVRLLVIAFGLVVAYPYIPGSNSAAFKGISIFFGVLVSLGSSSIIANVIAGYTMTYRRAFRIGDRIRVGEFYGDVAQSRLLVTYLRTPKNEEVIIPNSVILNGEVINYSSLAQEGGLILHTTVGIGYETPWRQVEAMLIEAAGRTPGLLSEPPPFVLQTSLGDFCITYEINAGCSNPQRMERIYAELHRNIQDIFNEYEVQIMTPAYEKDPPKPKIVPKENWYAAPARLPEVGEKPDPGK